MRVAVLLAGRELVGRAERDVRGRVLVDQRVVEDRVERADAALAVDERDLAEPRTRRRRARRTARAARRPRRPRSTTARPPSKRTRRPRTIVPPTTSGFVERTSPVDARGIRRREDLLRREVRHVDDAVDRLRSARDSQRDVGSRPTRRSVPGPSKCSASKRRAVRRSQTPTSRSWRSRPRRDGIGLVEAAHVQDLLPQALERGRGLERPGRRATPTPASGTARPSSSSCAR